MRRALPWGIAALALILAAAAWLTARRPAADAQVLRAEVRLPAAGTPQRVGSQVALSPAGDLMAYVDSIEDGTRLRVRRYDELEDTILAGTEGARSPFFSPDGEWIGFFAAGRLKKVSATGGTPLDLAGVPNDRGGQLVGRRPDRLRTRDDGGVPRRVGERWRGPKDLDPRRR